MLLDTLLDFDETLLASYDYIWLHSFKLASREARSFIRLGLETHVKTCAPVMNHILGKEVSVGRLAGFSFDRLWMIMLFYSITPYLSSSNVRDVAYMTLFVSLPAMAITLFFIIIVVKRSERVSLNRRLILGAAILTCLGTLLAAFSDTETSRGMLILGISAILTGIGSAVLFIGWLEIFSSVGARLALIEIPIALCAAFVMGFILTIAPQAPAAVTIACLPLASGYLILTDKGRHGGGGGCSQATAATAAVAADGSPVRQGAGRCAPARHASGLLRCPGRLPNLCRSGHLRCLPAFGRFSGGPRGVPDSGVPA
jgi:hypothetical protein